MVLSTDTTLTLTEAMSLFDDNGAKRPDYDIRLARILAARHQEELAMTAKYELETQTIEDDSSPFAGIDLEDLEPIPSSDIFTTAVADDDDASIKWPRVSISTQSIDELFADDVEDFEPGKAPAQRLNLSRMFNSPEEWAELRPIAIAANGLQLVTRTVMEGNNRITEAQVNTNIGQGGTRWVRSDSDIRAGEQKIYRRPNNTLFYDIDSSIIMELKYNETENKVNGKQFVTCIGTVWNLGAHGRGVPTKIGQVGPTYTPETISDTGARIYGARVGKAMLRRDVFASFPTYCRNWILADEAEFNHSQRCWDLLALFPEVDRREQELTAQAHALLIASVQAELTKVDDALREVLTELRAIRDAGLKAEGASRQQLATAYAQGQAFKTYLQDRQVEIAVKIRKLNDEPVEVIYPRVAA